MASTPNLLRDLVKNKEMGLSFPLSKVVVNICDPSIPEDVC